MELTGFHFFLDLSAQTSTKRQTSICFVPDLNMWHFQEGEQWVLASELKARLFAH